jgi:hypothetical protein
MQIKLADIVLDESIYPRSQVNLHAVQRMVHALESGTSFPPVVVEASTNRLVDGRHRVETFKRKGIEQIEAIEKVYTTEADLYADAVRLNIGHGQSLDQYCVRVAVAKLIEYGYERSTISDIVKVPVGHLENIVKGFATAPTGESVALKGGLQHMAGQAMNDRQIKVNRNYAGGKAEFYAKQVADLLETDLWPHNSVGFAGQMDRLVTFWVAINNAKSKAA